MHLSPAHRCAHSSPPSRPWAHGGHISDINLQPLLTHGNRNYNINPHSLLPPTMGQEALFAHHSPCFSHIGRGPLCASFSLFSHTGRHTRVLFPVLHTHREAIPGCYSVLTHREAIPGVIPVSHTQGGYTRVIPVSHTGRLYPVIPQGVYIPGRLYTSGCVYTREAIYLRVYIYLRACISQGVPQGVDTQGVPLRVY